MKCEFYIQDLGPCQNEATKRVTIDTSKATIPFGVQTHSFCTKCTAEYNLTGYTITNIEDIVKNEPDWLVSDLRQALADERREHRYTREDFANYKANHVGQWKKWTVGLWARLAESEAEREKTGIALNAALKRLAEVRELVNKLKRDIGGWKETQLDAALYALVRETNSWWETDND